MWEDFHWPFLDNPPFPWYPYTRCKAHKNQGLIVIRYYLALRGAENGVTAMVTPFFCVQG